MLRPVCPADPLLGNVADITECGAARLLPDVEPSLVPLSQGGVPWVAEVTILHSVTVGYFKCKQKNPQAHGYRCSLHPGVFQSIDFPQGT